MIFVTAFIFMLMDDDKDERGNYVGMAFFWPIMLPLSGIIIGFEKIGSGIKNIVGGWVDTRKRRKEYNDQKRKDMIKHVEELERLTKEHEEAAERLKAIYSAHPELKYGIMYEKLEDH